MILCIKQVKISMRMFTLENMIVIKSPLAAYKAYVVEGGFFMLDLPLRLH